MKSKKGEIMSRIVGFSTGCLKDLRWPLKKKIEFIQAAGADAVEISFATPGEFFKRNLSIDVLERLKGFAHVSIHAPWKGIVYEKGNLEALKIISDLIDVFAQLPGAHAVMHPNIILPDLAHLDSYRLPLWLENMDGKKVVGIKAEEFAVYREKFHFGFVLDLQHVYEHDPSMNSVDDFLKEMGDLRLKEVHISGQDGVYHHLPLALSLNSRGDKGCRKKNPVLTFPLISEGLICRGCL
jgi:sugar phosphate isomerase/epimerase